jgi:hypothetical protein
MTRLRIPLLFVLVLALAAVGTAATLEKSTNVPVGPGSLTQNAESTALYCSGLSGTTGTAVGHVTYLNTTGSTRTVNLEVASDTASSELSSLTLAPHSSKSVSPQATVKGISYAVAAQVNGGGVVGEEVAQGATAESPCTSAGVTDWYATGFDTTVGSTAVLSIYNPTATAAVFNITVFTANGFAAPALFQGMSIGAHAQIEVNLGAQIVNASNVGVHVRVLRGSIVIVGVQHSGSLTSFNSGQSSLATSAWFPRVTTVTGADAQIRVTNPGSEPANVVVDVALSSFKVAPQTITVAGDSSGDIVITPNSAIPAHGYATVQLKSDRLIATSLLTGSSAGLALSAPVIPSNEFLVADFSGRGFDAATVTNTSPKPVTVTFATMATGTRTSVKASTQLAGGATESILGLFSGLTTLKGNTLFVTSSKPSLVVATTLPTTPVGVIVVAPLDGR